MLGIMSDIDQPSLPIPFYPVLTAISVFMALSTLLQSINSPDKSSLSHSSSRLVSLCLVGPFDYISLFMKVSFNPDIIPSG